MELTSTNSPKVLFLNYINFLPPCLIIYHHIRIFLGDHGKEGTPDPIPNSEVKLLFADDTAYLHVGKQVVAKNFLKSPVELTKLRGFFRFRRILNGILWPAWFEFSCNLSYKAGRLGCGSMPFFRHYA